MSLLTSKSHDKSLCLRATSVLHSAAVSEGILHNYSTVLHYFFIYYHELEVSALELFVCKADAEAVYR